MKVLRFSKAFEEKVFFELEAIYKVRMLKIGKIKTPFLIVRPYRPDIFPCACKKEEKKSENKRRVKIKLFKCYMV